MHTAFQLRQQHVFDAHDVDGGNPQGFASIALVCKLSRRRVGFCVGELTRRRFDYEL